MNLEVHICGLSRGVLETDYAFICFCKVEFENENDALLVGRRLSNLQRWCYCFICKFLTRSNGDLRISSFLFFYCSMCQYDNSDTLMLK